MFRNINSWDNEHLGHFILLKVQNQKQRRKNSLNGIKGQTYFISFSHLLRDRRVNLCGFVRVSANLKSKSFNIRPSGWRDGRTYFLTLLFSIEMCSKITRVTPKDSYDYAMCDVQITPQNCFFLFINLH